MDTKRSHQVHSAARATDIEIETRHIRLQEFIVRICAQCMHSCIPDVIAQQQGMPNEEQELLRYNALADETMSKHCCCSKAGHGAACLQRCPNGASNSRAATAL